MAFIVMQLDVWIIRLMHQSTTKLVNPIFRHRREMHSRVVLIQIRVVQTQNGHDWRRFIHGDRHSSQLRVGCGGVVWGRGKGGV